MVRHGHRIPLEVMGTMVEMADVAWNALEHRREYKVFAEEEEEEIARLQSENHRLKSLLAEHVPLLHDISQAPSLAGGCPSDLYTRLLTHVDSPNFLEAVESLNKNLEANSNGGVSCNECPGDLTRWVLVTHDMTPHYLEEVSGIDNENYVIIRQENVVDGIANFIARCILENPKSKKILPQELQKAVSKALVDIKGRNKLKSLWDAGIIIYTLSTWGIFLAGLYRHRSIVKATAKGVHASSKFILRAL